MKLFAIEYVIVREFKSHTAQLLNRFLASGIAGDLKGVFARALDLGFFAGGDAQFSDQIGGNAES
jgi:hypothetical protein